MNHSQSRHHQHKPHIVVHENDVLCGRGVNIAHHSGNQRFRTLIQSRKDDAYCTSYSASEKRAVAVEIIRHIKSLQPSGRFLKRDGRGQVSRGLNGPWEELTERESLKKTCQALRDCNRQDRTGYALGVVPPDDVLKSANARATMGLSGKEQAAAAAALSSTRESTEEVTSLKRQRDQINSTLVGTPLSARLNTAAEVTDSSTATPTYQSDYILSSPIKSFPYIPHAEHQSEHHARLSPSVEHTSDWLKKQRRFEEENMAINSNSINSLSSISTSFSQAIGLGGDGMLAPPPLPDHPEPNSYGNYANYPLGHIPSENAKSWYNEKTASDASTSTGPSNSTYGFEEMFMSRT